MKPIRRWGKAAFVAKIVHTIKQETRTEKRTPGVDMVSTCVRCNLHTSLFIYGRTKHSVAKLPHYKHRATWRQNIITGFRFRIEE
jgi:hypothetical protein